MKKRSIDFTFGHDHFETMLMSSLIIVALVALFLLPDSSIVGRRLVLPLEAVSDWKLEVGLRFDMRSEPQVGDDPVLGKTYRWIEASRSVSVNDRAIYYDNQVATRAQSPKLLEAQEFAREFLQQKGFDLSNLTQDVSFNLFQFTGSELKLVSKIEEADLVQLDFKNTVNGQKIVSIFVTGASDIWRMIYLY